MPALPTAWMGKPRINKGERHSLGRVGLEPALILSRGGRSRPPVLLGRGGGGVTLPSRLWMRIWPVDTGSDPRDSCPMPSAAANSSHVLPQKSLR